MKSAHPVACLREEKPPRSVTVLGSTGSIGASTLSIIKAHPGRYPIQTLTAGDNVGLLAEQAKHFRARRAVIANAALYQRLKELLSGTGIEAHAGEDAVAEAASLPCDVTVSAIVGAAALKPTVAAIRTGRTVALANKECMVCAGELIKREAQKHGATLLPVDSEHNAMFQLFDFKRPEWVAAVTITASGGPFRDWTLEQMKTATPAQAVKHPNWSMGAKISVDSATLMNKGLELIEAYHLFPLKPEQLKVLIHPQSIVHALIAMKDGSVLSQMSHPDMRTPIACALAWPERIDAPVRNLNLAEVGNLTFYTPDTSRFPALELAREAMEQGGSAPAVLNAANETAVKRFLAGEINFLDIAKTVEKTLQSMENKVLQTVDDVLACDKEARAAAESFAWT